MPNTPPLSSTPSQPTEIHRDLGSFSFYLSVDGLTLAEAMGADLYLFTIEEAMDILTFLRSPGVARLLTRAWLAQQHAEGLPKTLDEAENDAGDETRDKLHAGRRKAA